LELFTEVILYTNKLTILEMIGYLKQYFLQGIALFFAITPLIAIVTIFRKGYWLSVIFAMIYSFAGVFTSQSQMFKSIYPISASFCFSGFYDVSGMQFMIACISLIISLLIAGIILRSARVYRME
jgi:ABC-2 type transport system permease protein/bacitracin transport system permease protein